MNEFTKNQLIEIFALLGEECSRFEIYRKIQSMIENYWEHKEECHHYLEAQPVEYAVEWTPIPTRAPPTVVKCKHCLEVMNDNK